MAFPLAEMTAPYATTPSWSVQPLIGLRRAVRPSSPSRPQPSRSRFTAQGPTSGVRSRQGRGGGEDPSLPRLGAYSAACLTCAARAGPERHCRERRGPSAGGGPGNRGAIRGRLHCTDREHGGTRAVSRRSGSPREARSDGPNVLLVSPLRNVARGLQALLAWRDPLAERKPVSASLRMDFPHRLAGGGGRGPAARRRISQPKLPNKWRVNSPRTDG
jgi:hypothetical protein